MKKVLKVVLVVLLASIVAFVSVILIAYFHRSSSSDKKVFATTNPWIFSDTKIGAHRSGAGIEPEETLRAFKHCTDAKDFKVDIFEFDLHITKDEQLVLLHDDDLDRTSDSQEVFGRANVQVKDRTYEELRQLNMGAKFENENGEKPYADLKGKNVPEDIRILKLSDALDYILSKGDYRFIIEIKDQGQLGMKTADLLHDMLKEKNILDKTAVGTFNPEVLRYIQRAHKDLTIMGAASEVISFYTASLFNSQHYSPNYQMLTMPFGDYAESYFVNLGTTRCINYAHQNNLSVAYWTINDEENMEYLSGIGADIILTDYPDKLYKIMHEKNPSNS